MAVSEESLVKLFMFTHPDRKLGKFFVVASNVTQAYSYIQMYRPQQYQPERWKLEGEWVKGQVVEAY